MKTKTHIIRIFGGLFVLMITNITPPSASAAVSDTTLSKNWSKEEEAIHKTLEENGYTHISQLGLIKSDVHPTEYFVTFTDDEKIYNAYFNKKGKLKELKQVAAE